MNGLFHGALVALLVAGASPRPARAQGVPARRVPLDAIVPRDPAATLSTGDGTAPTTQPGGASEGVAVVDPDDGRDLVRVPAGARSLHVLRAGEVIRQRPEGNAPRRGTAARDAYLPVYEATLGPGCRLRWYRVGRDAWMCIDEAELSTAAPRAIAQPVVPEGEVTPQHYAFAAYSGVQTYRRVEDVENQDWAEQLERGMGVAIDGQAREGGQTYVHTSSGRWVAARDLRYARPSERVGLAYEPGEALGGVGFVRARVHTYDSPESAARGRGRPQGFLAPRAPVHVREEQLVAGRRVVRTDAGWVAAGAVALADVPGAPTGVGPAERWVDVDTHRQVLVAFEGPRPVYAALVSTGRAGHATLPGSFRVWIRLAATDMSNEDNTELDATEQVYRVERVPWVMYFHGDQALHAAYWHDQFGTRRSHGCVNLAPRDARWLFGWAPPGLPPGWNAVFPTADEPGMLVRVR